MKRIIPFIIFACAASWTEAQEPVVLPDSDTDESSNKLQVGVRMAMNVTFPSDGFGEYHNGSGVLGGAVVEIPLYGHMYAEPGLMLYYSTIGVNNYAVNDLPYDGSVRNFGIRVPVNVGYKFKVSDNISLSLFTGPWFNFNLLCRQYATPNFDGPTPKGSKNLFDYGWHRFDAQWGFGVKATFSGRYVIGISGGVGTKAMATRTDSGHKMHLRRSDIAITLGFNF